MRPRRHRPGWHHTGDIGYLGPGNYLYIVDRAKDMIITGRFNVYSAKVEQALIEHPGGAGLRGDRAAQGPKQVEVWPDLPRSKVGRILKNEVKSRLLGQADRDRY